ncbi:hypothetical protein C8R46DRAFT_1000449 [Mycena filopes]|nr:hypothetical protein C8R46DRAFT_1000449 [Mycena filopes]
MDLNPDPIRSADFWFDDGTIVLQAGPTIYRVYRGLLASRSTVFHDTFSIPQPPEETNLIEGCPVVQLHDTSKDLTYFLKALHNHSSYKTCPVANIYELSSVLRLSDKYDVPTLRATMISILSDVYPTTLTAWDARSTPPGYTVRRSHHVAALNLALKMNIRPILPIVMYSICVHVGVAEIIARKPPNELRIADADYKIKCAEGWPKLVAVGRKELDYLRRDEDLDEEDCEDIAACDAERFRWLGFELDEDRDDPLTDSNADAWSHFKLCAKCHSTAKERWTAARKELWDDLPRIFGLGTWKELLA